MVLNKGYIKMDTIHWVVCMLGFLMVGMGLFALSDLFVLGSGYRVLSILLVLFLIVFLVFDVLKLIVSSLVEFRSVSGVVLNTFL